MVFVHCGLMLNFVKSGDQGNEITNAKISNDFSHKWV